MAPSFFTKNLLGHIPRALASKFGGRVGRTSPQFEHTKVGVSPQKYPNFAQLSTQLGGMMVAFDENKQPLKHGDELWLIRS